MGGLYRLFLRIMPIITLICFVCFGITHTFDRNEEHQLTYLTHETRNVGTQENPNNIEIYSFNMPSYINNLDIDILERATNNIIDTQKYHNNIAVFSRIWEDGYNFGDGVQTTLNAIILVINSIIVGINIFIAPLRICAGIILTGLSILGINIDRNTTILTSLNAILDNTAIPLLNPTFNRDRLDALNNTRWQFETHLDTPDHAFTWNLPVNFTSDGGGNYKKIECGQTTQNDTWIRYTDIDNNVIYVYQNGIWLYNDSKTINIGTNNFNKENFIALQAFLYQYATQI